MLCGASSMYPVQWWNMMEISWKYLECIYVEKFQNLHKLYSIYLKFLQVHNNLVPRPSSLVRYFDKHIDKQIDRHWTLDTSLLLLHMLWTKLENPEYNLYHYHMKSLEDLQVWCHGIHLRICIISSCFITYKSQRYT